MSSLLAIPKSKEALPDLVQRAADALLSAKSSAEVLDARNQARLAYDAAKSVGRIARAKQAHDTLIAEVYRAQADALLIESQAKARLADEYDAAQDRGEVVGRAGGGDSTVEARNAATAADLGLRRDEIHEARQIRDAEKERPGLAERALNEMLDRGAEPTKAALRRSVMDAVKDANKRPSNKNPLHVKDATRDAAIGFTGDCRRIADTHDIDRLAAFSGHHVFREQMVTQARAALDVLSAFLQKAGEIDA